MCNLFFKSYTLVSNQNLLDALIVVNPIPVPVTTTVILSKIVQQYYANFVEKDIYTIFELVAAADYMDIRPLFDLTMFRVTLFITGRPRNEIEEIFKVSNKDEAIR